MSAPRARPTRAGSIQSAVKEAYAAFGGLEAISAAISVSTTTLSYGTALDEHRPGGIGVNYLDQLARQEAAVAVVLAQHFAALGGGVFQPVDLGEADASVLSAIDRHLREGGEATSAALNALGAKCVRTIDSAIEEADDSIEASVSLRAALKAKRGRLA